MEKLIYATLISFFSLCCFASPPPYCLELLQVESKIIDQKASPSQKPFINGIPTSSARENWARDLYEAIQLGPISFLRFPEDHPRNSTLLYFQSHLKENCPGLEFKDEENRNYTVTRDLLRDLYSKNSQLCPHGKLIQPLQFSLMNPQSYFLSLWYPHAKIIEDLLTQSPYREKCFSVKHNNDERAYDPSDEPYSVEPVPKFPEVQNQ
jgi:hypothetical protein